MIGTVLSAVAYAQTGASTQAAQTGASAPPEAHEQEIRAFAEATGISVGAAREYSAMTDAVSDLGRAAEKEHADTYGGLFRDPKTGIVSMYFTENASVSSELGRRFGIPRSRIRPLVADFTLAELDRVVAAITADFGSLQSEGYELSHVSVDVATNSAKVALVGNDSSAEAALRARYGNAVRVVLGEAPARTTAVVQPIDRCLNRSTCTTVLRGGVEAIGTDGFVCTTGFMGRRWNTGADVLWTAGHCFGGGLVQVTHSGVVIGSTIAQSFSGSVDGEILSVSQAWYPSNQVYYDHSFKTYPITKRAGREYAENVGDPICRTGITTGPICGTLTAKNATLNLDGTVLQTQRMANVCSLPGDSGGPLVFAGAAFGVNSGGNFTAHPNGTNTCNASPWSSFSSLAISEGVLGFDVRTVATF